jgi:hypothetical protein
MAHDLIARLREANIFKSIKYTARSLLDLADQHGHVRIDYDAAKKVTEINETQTLRTHLHTLKKAGIVANYHLNGAVDITFDGYPSRAISLDDVQIVRGERASVRGERAIADEIVQVDISHNDESCALTAQKCALTAQKCAVSAHDDQNGEDAHYISARAPAHALVGWLDTSNSIDPVVPTNQPATPTDKIANLPDLVEQAQTYALLVSVRMRADNAKSISERIPFAVARQYVANWWFNRQSTGGRFENSPGIVVHWLSDPENYPPERDYPLEMLRDICPAAITNAEAAEMRAQAEAETLAIDDTPHESPPTLSDDELAAIWQAAQPSLEKLASYKLHLQPCRLLRSEGDVLIVGAPPGIAEHVQSRFVTALRRALGSATNATRLPSVRIEVYHAPP